MTWTLVLLLASGEMSSGPVDPYRCRQTEMRIASGWVGHREGWHEDRRGPAAALSCGWWQLEPDVGRVAYGVPSRVDRLKGLGNAVVPQIPEMIGRAILEACA